MKGLGYILTLLGGEAANALNSADKNVLQKITEIRIRKNNFLILTVNNKACFIERDGTLCAKPDNNCIFCTENYVDKLFFAFCDYSVYSNENSIRQGFITLKNGARVGIAGSAVHKNGEISTVKDIASLIIRIPNEVKGCSLGVLNDIYKDELPSVIVAGAPGSGKTTMLRDLAYNLSNGFGGNYYRVVMIDERNELAGKTKNGALSLGANCDVLSQFTKVKGIEIATRSLSADIIVCDEVATVDEVRAISHAFSSGISFLLSVHIGKKEDIKRKKLLRELINTDEFSYIVFLNREGYGYEIIDISEVKSEISRIDSGTVFNDACGHLSL